MYYGSQTSVNLMGMNALSKDLIEEIISRTSPVDVCGNLSIVSKNFLSAAKSDYVWHTFLPADLISRRGVSNPKVIGDPWEKIDSDTQQAFPTKKELYLFLSDNPLIIDDGSMYFWLDKLSGKRCFCIVANKLWISEPHGWSRTNWCPSSRSGHDAPELSQVINLEIHGKISTSLLSPDTTYTAYLVINCDVYCGGFGEEQPLETYVGIDGGCEGENRTVYIPSYPMLDGPRDECDLHEPVLTGPQYPHWIGGNYEVELGDYFNREGGDNGELKMSLSEVKSGKCKSGISMMGIEIRPKGCTTYMKSLPSERK